MKKTAFQWPKGQTRYMVLADLLADQIQNGQYKRGDYLPAEAQLCDTYGVSRFTIRQAIQEINKRGLVTTHHGIGTEVKSLESTDKQFEFSFNSVDEFLTAAKDLKLVVEGMNIQKADDAISDILGCEPCDEYLLVVCHRLTRDKEEPVAHVELIIPLKFSGIKKSIGHRRSSISHLIEQKYDLRTAQIRQTIEPVTLDQKKADFFGVARNSAGLLVSRAYIDSESGVFLYVRNIHAGKHAVLAIDIRRKYS